MAQHENSATTGGKNKPTLLWTTTMAKGKKGKAKDTTGNTPLPLTARSTRSKTKTAPETSNPTDTESVAPAKNSAHTKGMFLL